MVSKFTCAIEEDKSKSHLNITYGSQFKYLGQLPSGQVLEQEVIRTLENAERSLRLGCCEGRSGQNLEEA